MVARGTSEDLGGRIQWVREHKLGMGHRALERAMEERGVEVSHVSISRYEKGDREPPLGFVLELSKLSGVPVGWIAAGEGEREHVEPLEALRQLTAISQILEGGWGVVPIETTTPVAADALPDATREQAEREERLKAGDLASMRRTAPAAKDLAARKKQKRG